MAILEGIWTDLEARKNEEVWALKQIIVGLIFFLWKIADFRPRRVSASTFDIPSWQAEHMCVKFSPYDTSCAHILVKSRQNCCLISALNRSFSWRGKKMTSFREKTRALFMTCATHDLIFISPLAKCENKQRLNFGTRLRQNTCLSKTEDRNWEREKTLSN